MKTLGDYADGDGERWVRRQTPLGLFLKIVGVVIALTVLGGVIGLIGGWFSEAGRQVSAGNVKGNWQFAYDYNNSLKTTARQWCDLKTATDAETDPSIKSQRVSQMLAVSQNYQRIEAAYDAHLQDAFRLKYIRPHNVPTVAPTLTEETQAVC